MHFRHKMRTRREREVLRVKISANDYGIGKLEFGRSYYIAYGGVTYGETFVFTRKNMIEMCEVINNKKVSSYWISKRELKQILKSGAIHWMTHI